MMTGGVNLGVLAVCLGFAIRPLGQSFERHSLSVSLFVVTLQVSFSSQGGATRPRHVGTLRSLPKRRTHNYPQPQTTWGY